ncbi:MAG TPA: sulfur carrier protein ThiS [Jatrophihabitantaceae bacterium]|nr:sulfur carrier protein ThiS [Jatrophihabitantaceae bacterium]
MNLIVNGSARELPVTTLAELLALVAGSLRGSAAAVDGEVVPRGEWDAFQLRDGQAVEVLTAVQGG